MAILPQAISRAISALFQSISAAGLARKRPAPVPVSAAT